jgi:thioredoxin 1
MGEITAVTDTTFEAEVLESVTPVLVDFWAEWCGPCHFVRPEVEAVAVELGEQLKVVSLDIDVNPGATARYGVMSIPTLLLFAGGQEKARIVGARKRDTIRDTISAQLTPQA